MMLIGCRVGNASVLSAGLGGSNASVSGVATGVADELGNERIAALEEAVAESSDTEVIGRI